MRGQHEVARLGTRCAGMRYGGPKVLGGRGVSRGAPLARAQGAAQHTHLRGLGDDVGTERHLDAAGRGAADGHVEEDLRKACR